MIGLALRSYRLAKEDHSMVPEETRCSVLSIVVGHGCERGKHEYLVTAARNETQPPGWQ